MATTTVGSGTPATLLVDGEVFGRASARFAYEPFIGAVFTADAGAVARRLPSPQLHPVRWFNGRAMVGVAANSGVWTMSALPPLATAEMGVAALVTHGDSVAVPVLPWAGGMLPLVGGALDRRYQWGAYFFDTLVTNRVGAEWNRLVYGYPATVAAIRQDRTPDRLRFTATDRVGADILSLEVRTGGLSQSVDQIDRVYSVRDSYLLRQSEHAVGQMRIRLGRSSARLRPGRGPFADLVRSLGMSPQPVLAYIEPCQTLLEHGPERLAPADDQPTRAPTAVEPVVAPMTIGHEDGRKEIIDRLPEGFPCNPAGTFELAQG